MSDEQAVLNRQENIKAILAKRKITCEICETTCPKGTTLVMIQNQWCEYDLWLCPACIKAAARLIEEAERMKAQP